MVQGDGDEYPMLYNGQSELFVTPTCPEQPIRGGVAGCGRSINLSACSASMSGPPCLEVYR
ncbi:MAG TPA: hypothetical protein VMS65_05030, partial [Polyangiaceae bacterium]|nr:hypothetical protein [Polyangiaceae bacterium]